MDTSLNEDVDSKYEPVMDKAYNKNVGSNKGGSDTRGNHVVMRDRWDAK